MIIRIMVTGFCIYFIFTQLETPVIETFIITSQEKSKYQQPVRDSLRSVLAWGWSLDQDQSRLTANRESMKRRMSKDMVGYF